MSEGEERRLDMKDLRDEVQQVLVKVTETSTNVINLGTNYERLYNENREEHTEIFERVRKVETGKIGKWGVRLAVAFVLGVVMLVKYVEYF